MTGTKDIGEEWIMDFAAGNLGEAHSLFVLSHLAMQPDGKDRLAAAQAIGGAVFEQVGACPVSEGLKNTVMASLGDDSGEGGAQETSPVGTGTLAPSGMVLPKPLADYLGKDADDLKWRFMAPGLKVQPVLEGPAGEKLFLMRGKPGVKVAEHSHTGRELILVIKGALSDQTGRYIKGEVAEYSSDDTHGQKMEDDDGECICLSVTDGPLKFKSWMARASQPFIGI